MLTLSDRQKEILRTIAKSERLLYATELGRIFGISQIAVSSSMDNLIRDSLIHEEEKEKSRTKMLYLTDKGAFTALSTFSDVTMKILIQNHDYLFTKDDETQLSEVEDVMSERFANIYYRTIAELALNLNLFDPNGAFILSGKRYNSDIKQRYGHYFQTVLIEITFRLKDAARDIKKGEYIHWQQWLEILQKHEIDPNKAQMIIQ